MEPLSAFAVASNILQVIDLGGKIVSGSLKVYGSLSGSTSDNEVLQDVSERLQRLAKDLRATTLRGNTKSEKNVSELSIRCQEVAAELAGLLNYIRAKRPGKKWDSMVAAFRQLRTSEQIEKLAQRLDTLQSQLSLHLLDILNNKQSQISYELTALRSQCQRIDLDRAEQMDCLHRDVLNAISLIGKDAPSCISVEGAQLQSKRIQSVSTSFTAAISLTRSIASEIRILQNIRFSAIRQRLEDISKAHEATFHWIFDTRPSTSRSPQQFRNWLHQQNGIFWIKGKPGSGKSTFMKFVSTHKMTLQLLQIWASEQQLVTASYYFWNAGSELQKTQEGLVRSLLFEILRKCPDLIHSVQSKLPDYELDLEHMEWRLNDLIDAFIQVLEQSQLKTKFCFFIDGLDEYGGQDHDSLIRLIQSISRKDQLKICVSSRPWNEFEEAFGQQPDLVLKLEVHTANDIKDYVERTFETNIYYQRVQSQDRRYKDLTQQIVNRAEGVFLWVFLAVRSLMKGMTNADSVARLELRLQALPPTLDDFFRQMLLSVEPEYRQESSNMILTALAVEDPLELIIYSVLDEDLKLESLASTTQLFEDEIEIRHSTMKRRINARSKGILETKVNSDRIPFFGFRVEFLHRTARDFLNTPQMRRELGDSKDLQILLTEKLVRACITAIALAPPGAPWTGNGSNLDMILHRVLWHSEKLESLTKTETAVNLDFCEKVLTSDETHWPWRSKRTRFLGLAAQHGLAHYLAYRITTTPQLLTLNERPILDYALKNGHEQHSLFGRNIRSDVVEVLLQCGASPNQHYIRGSVWVRFVQNLYNNSKQLPEIYPGDLTDLIEMLIQYGAKRDEKISVPGQSQTSADVKMDVMDAIETMGISGSTVAYLRSFKPLEMQREQEASSGLVAWIFGAIGWT